MCATLGGGEPTIHPQFFELVDVLKKAGMGTIWVYTNGRKIARDPAFAARWPTRTSTWCSSGTDSPTKSTGCCGAVL